MKKINSEAGACRSIRFTLALSVIALTLLILAVPAATESDDKSTFTTIDFPGANISTAWAINFAGDIIGTYTYGDQHPQVGSPSIIPLMASYSAGAVSPRLSCRGFSTRCHTRSIIVARSWETTKEASDNKQS